MKKLLCLALALALLLSACGKTPGAAQNSLSVYYLRKTAYRTDGELLTAQKLTPAEGEDEVKAAAAALAKTPADLALQSPRLALPLPADPALKAFGFHQPLQEQRHRCAAWS